MPPWETGSTTTASGNEDGLRILLSRVAALTWTTATTSRAHSHAVILDEFSCINADIDSDIMTASMKDQYFGDVNKLQQRFDMQLRKLARRWHVQGSSFSTDYQPVLAELFAEHRSNVQDRAHWTSASLQTHHSCPVIVGCHSSGSLPFACSCDLPIFVFHAVAQDLLHR